ncbi:MFS transporter [Streptomyces mashuensis]|uniref:MFS transporter n=1 Tax=Streptomyces mashuensis TaxID=33904 RepID=A0A919B884_9ACTN|nr:MFS transporter [Streptomyces mashuensis]GHF65536.1 MFS transporter [Streptomyces mashuensis]
MEQTSSPSSPASPAMPSGTSVARPAGTASLVAALVAAAVACQLCISMPTPALPDIADRLHTGTATVGMAQAVFFLLGGLLSVIVAACSDYGRTRTLMVAALALAVVGSIVAAAAPTTAVFAVGRALQATATAVFPLALRVMRQTLGPREFGRAMGLITAANGGIVGLDGLLSGWLTDRYGFRSVFVVMAVFGVATMVFLARTVPETGRSSTGRLDWPGLAVLSLGLACVELGVGMAGRAPVGGVVVLLVLGAGFFVAFPVVERRRPEPLLPPGHLSSRSTWPVLLTSMLVTMGMLSTVNFVVPVFGQNDRFGFGLSATGAALLFIVPVCLVNVFMAPAMGTLAARTGWRRVLRWSTALMVPVLVALALGLHSQVLAVLLVVLVGFGLAGAMTPLNGLSAILAAPRNPSLLPGVNSAAYGIGSSLGFLMASRLAGSSDAAGAASADGFRAAVWTAAAVIALAFAASLLIRGRAGDEEKV